MNLGQLLEGGGRRTLLACGLALALLGGTSSTALATYGRTARLENATFDTTYYGYAYAYAAFYYEPTDANLAQGYYYASIAYSYADYLWNVAYYDYFDGGIDWPSYQYNWRLQMVYSYYAAQYELEGYYDDYYDYNAFYGYLHCYYAYLHSYYTTFVEPPLEPTLTPEFEKLLALHNSERLGLGFPTLTIDARLMQIAQDHADWMLVNDTLSHEGANGETVMDRATNAGYGYTKIAQNILFGYATEEEVFDIWIRALTGEARNIEDLKWDHVGFGVAGVGDDLYWCAVYGTERN